MSRLLPLLTALFLIFAAAPASAQVLSASQDDPAERPDDPGRDIQSIASTYDPAGTWTVHARFHGAPAAETSALLRVFLGVRAQDGTCQEPSPAILLAAYTDPADRGGKGFVDNMSVNLVKTTDDDGRGITVTFTDQRLANRGVCGIASTTLSRNEGFDRVGAFAFPGAPTEPAPAPPADAAGDTTPPGARIRVLRDPKSARRGIVRVSLVAVTEPAHATVVLHGPGGMIARAAGPVAPGQDVRFALELGKRQLKRLKRKGRLAVRVETVLQDAAGNESTLGAAATLRARRSL